jgi:hypothetical protein
MIYDQEEKKERSEPAPANRTTPSGSARGSAWSVWLDSTLGLDIDLSRAFDR